MLPVRELVPGNAKTVVQVGAATVAPVVVQVAVSLALEVVRGVEVLVKVVVLAHRKEDICKVIHH